MRKRKGWIVTDPDGFNWVFDCPVELRDKTNARLKVRRVVIFGAGSWCEDCRSGKH